MTQKEEIIEYIKDNYGAQPEYLWAKYPEYAVFRHSSNRKWFAAILRVKKSQLGLESNDEIDIIDIKGDEIINGSLRMRKGIFPGYHMNKRIWLSLLLDGTLDKEEIFDLIDMSYECTK